MSGLSAQDVTCPCGSRGSALTLFAGHLPGLVPPSWGAQAVAVLPWAVREHGAAPSVDVRGPELPPAPLAARPLCVGCMAAPAPSRRVC